MVVHPLEPIADERSRVLILGSMPGTASLAARQYYAHPRNRLWPVMFTLLGEPFSQDYAERIALVLRHGVALWDSIFSCERPGSLDKDIKNETPQDIPGLTRRFPGISSIVCNGQKSFAVYQKHFGKILPVQALALPSTSPVPRKNIRTMEDLLPHWRVILDLLA